MPPYLRGSHWFLAWYDVGMSTLFVADSLFSVNEKTKEIEVLKALLLLALQCAGQNTQSFLVQILARSAEVVPLQMNGYDCGVFTCAFAILISRHCSLRNVNQKDMPDMRLRVLETVVTGQLDF